MNMQITPAELLAEAGRMALELRLKDRAIAELEATVADLSAQLESRANAMSGERAKDET